MADIKDPINVDIFCFKMNGLGNNGSFYELAWVVSIRKKYRFAWYRP